MKRILAFASILFITFVSTIRADLPSKKVLTLDVAKKIAAAAEAEANKRGATVVIVVVDDGGYPLVLLRLDNTQVASVEVGIGKARTAAIGSRAPNRWWESTRTGKMRESSIRRCCELKMCI